MALRLGNPLFRQLISLPVAFLSVTACSGATKSFPDASSPDAAAPDGVAGDASRTCPSGDLTCDPLGPFPATLAAAGLAAPPPIYVRAASAHPYVPAPELYSDGLHKDRLLLLPAGSTVDNSNAAVWKFPVGALLIKTFFDEGGAGAQGGSQTTSNVRRPIETRLIRHGTDRFEPFEYAVYKWNADGTSAERLDIAGNRRGSAAVVIAGRSFTHTIPSQNDCAECHGRNAMIKSTVIGFDEVRLNHLVGAGATRTELEELASAGVFSATVPASPATITDPDPVLAQLKRFVFGNCVHCHNGSMNLVDLHPNVFVANTINQTPESPGTTPPPGSKRVVPGRPEDSVVFLQTRGTDLPLGLRPMPQVGVEVRDLPAFAVELQNMKTWISSLPP
jgi:hypothetical protein